MCPKKYTRGVLPNSQKDTRNDDVLLAAQKQSEFVQKDMLCLHVIVLQLLCESSIVPREEKSCFQNYHAASSVVVQRHPIESFLTYCNQPMLLPQLQQPVLSAKILKISPAEAIKNISQTLTSSTCFTLTSNKIFVSTNSKNFVFPSRTPTC
ncbi:hypothetical protein TNCV_2121171 [Trichonephila clavipes]|nr:hypothetical protein TNCV_2121171 [Trichonephila clavipes]